MTTKKGSIEVICGGMFCGKTEELIRRIRRARIARQNVKVFKPSIDDRYHTNKVSTHYGDSHEATPVISAYGIEEHLDGNEHVVAVDEVQFFDNEIIGVVTGLVEKGVRVILAGLDTDFRGEPFGAMPQLLCLATDVLKLHAICTVCSEPAQRTQRLVNGEPAHYNDPLIVVGAESETNNHESYTARCLTHHVVPR